MYARRTYSLNAIFYYEQMVGRKILKLVLIKNFHHEKYADLSYYQTVCVKRTACFK